MTDEEMINNTAANQQIDRLKAIVHRLRAPNGCPWDAEQTHESLVSNLIEETYEVVDTIRREDYPHLKEELGDLLLQVVFHSELANEDDRYNLDDVTKGICDKLIRRHPHVFSTSHISNTEGVLTQWEEIKRKEKGEFLDLPYMHKVGEGLPALLSAQKIQKKASKIGFDWPNTDGVIDKIREELEEVEEELNKGDSPALDEEIGDLMFSVVNLARKLKKNPELILHEANEKFKKRFTKMEEDLKSRELKLKSSGLEVLESSWKKFK